MHRKALALLIGLLAGCGSEPAEPMRVVAESPPPTSPTPRVVLLVSLDTLRADRLGLYGYPRPTSPLIDAIASEGVVFEDASSTAPWTLPAHASMLTGLYPSRHGANSNDRQLASGIPTLATLLARAGYTTAAVVNSFRVARTYGLQRGFEHTLYVREAEERVGPSTWVTDQAIDWLKEFRNERLFLFVHYFDVHSDYASLPRYEGQFVSEYAGEADGSGQQLFRYQVAHLVDECRADPTQERCGAQVPDSPFWKQPPLELEPGDEQHLTDLYDANLRQTDDELGRLLSFARKEGILDESLLILTSDHGEEFLEHGSVGHSRTQYQEVLRVPLIVRGPRIPAATRVATPVSLVDLLPTVLGVLGLEIPDDLDGLDLSALWRPDAAQARAGFERRILFAEANHTPGSVDALHAARRGRHKLIYDRQTGEAQLFDLELDPREQQNLAEREAAVVADLIEILQRRSDDARISDPVELSDEESELLQRLGYAQ